jgi:hypothetical protein
MAVRTRFRTIRGEKEHLSAFLPVPWWNAMTAGIGLMMTGFVRFDPGKEFYEI